MIFTFDLKAIDTSYLLSWLKLKKIEIYNKRPINFCRKIKFLDPHLSMELQDEYQIKCVHTLPQKKKVCPHTTTEKKSVSTHYHRKKYLSNGENVSKVP